MNRSVSIFHALRHQGSLGVRIMEDQFNNLLMPLRLAISMAFLLCMAGCNEDAVPVRYFVTELPSERGRVFRPTDINNEGQMAGSLIERTVVLQDGKFVDLPVPSGARYAQTRSISEFGMVGGYSTGWNPQGAVTSGSLGILAVVWKQGEVRVLPLLAADSESFLSQINDLGVAVGTEFAGSSFAPTSTRAVLWQDGTVLDLGVPPGMSDCAANGVNSHNATVGQCSSRATPDARGFLWMDGQMVLLPKLPNHPYAYASAINSAGVIVGTAYTTGASTPVVWRGRVIRPLGIPAGATSGSVEDVNQHEQAVGVAGVLDVPGSNRAVIWQGREVSYLDEMIDEADPLAGRMRFSGQPAINDLGQIIVEGVDAAAPFGTTKGYLLTPSSSTESSVRSRLGI